jgi:diguanylate cyclase (GGDEF)-like protein/putative nucleotidyltransferase with HDIG domain
LLLVYAASLSMVVLSSAELTVLGSDHVIAGAIRATTSVDAAIVSQDLGNVLSKSELGSPLPEARRAIVVTSLKALAARYGFLSTTILGPGGEVVASSAPGSVPPGLDDHLRNALAGTSGATITSPAGVGGGPRDVLTEDLPLLQDGRVVGVAVITRDAAPILTDASAAWQDLVLVILAAAFALAALLYLIFRAANARLVRQELQLIEATRHDPLTGLINHGTGVGVLTQLIGKASEQTLISIALVDIDNFHLLNTVHGEEAADTALCAVARVLSDEAGAWLPVARYGPDEFLIVAVDDAAQHLVATLHTVRHRLDTLTLRFGDSERLPVTVSIGVAHFPFHATAVSELLSEATIALGDAKASGGAELRVTGAWQRDGSGTRHSSFDVLQGLVLVTDGKDRYTRRHSEDVARYAVFLAEQLALPPDMRTTIRTAGLLHDIGKIGIPDEILRKPGRLTPHESEIVKQHVALGELIVRDLPDVEVVRAGIRYHHERWDGAGYLDQLAGEQIPLVARVLAVADAFSAMTTSRPYRQALSLDEAVGRLLNAAGSQLEERLVRVFVQGLESVPGAPLPEHGPLIGRRARGAA